MHKNQFMKISLVIAAVFVLFMSPSINHSFAQGTNDLPNIYKRANDHFMLGELSPGN